VCLFSACVNIWLTSFSRSYIYLLQFSGKTLALIGAAVTLLDAVATSAVSAATASAYLSAEIHSMPISTSMLAVLFLIALGVLALAGIRENASATAAVFLFHARITRLLRVTQVLTIYSLDYSNGCAGGRGYRALGYARSPFYHFETKLGPAPRHCDWDRTCNILWHLHRVSRSHRYAYVLARGDISPRI